MKKLLLLIPLIVLSSCASKLVDFALKKNGVLDTKAVLQPLEYDDKKIVFLNMIHLGTKEYYADVKSKIDSLQKEGFFVMYEGLYLRKSERIIKENDTVNYLKFRKVMGIDPLVEYSKMKPFSERKTDETSTDAAIGQLFGLAGKNFPEAKMIFFQPPSIPGFGFSGGFELKLLDKSGGDLKEFDKKTQEYIAALMQRPEIMYAQTPFNTNYAQYEINLDIVRAKQSGVSVSNIFSALQGYIGGNYVSDFTRFGKQYRVMLQALPGDRKNISSLNGMFVRTSTSAMAPLSQFVTLEKVYGPQSVNRFNLFTSANISGAPKPGYSSGDAIKAVQEVAQQTLSTNYGVDFTGLTREEINAGSQTILIFALCIVFVYFILAAQYESYMLPFAVILSLPTGIMGAFLSQKVAGLENNIYFQIALVMLVGLLAKNAILIVEFALQRRKHGETIVQAAIDGAKARLRPILMTSFAFILGLMPLVFAGGVGYIGNRSIGTGAAFGLLIGTILGVFVIPVLFVIFQALQEKIKPVIFDQKAIQE